MELNDDNILRFWQWFVQNQNTIKECIENEHSENREYIVEQMNEQILGFGVLTWDLGQNDDDHWFLMLSPNGKEDMLKVSQKIMDFAPEQMGWLFYASRPAKSWNRQFTIYDDYMDEQFIDARSWNYVAFDTDEGKLELVIEAKNIAQLDAELAETAVEQFVVQEVGELIRMLLISSIVVVDIIESEYESSKEPIGELREHLEEIF